MLRIPHCVDNLLTDGGKVVSLTHPSHFSPQKHYYFNVSGTHFCWRLSKPQGLVRPEGLRKFIKITSSGIEPTTTLETGYVGNNIKTDLNVNII
jgi:hypothetical protein